jgi:hypothetical protein
MEATRHNETSVDLAGVKRSFMPEDKTLLLNNVIIVICRYIYEMFTLNGNTS